MKILKMSPFKEQVDEMLKGYLDHGTNLLVLRDQDHFDSLSINIQLLLKKNIDEALNNYNERIHIETIKQIFRVLVAVQGFSVENEAEEKEIKSIYVNLFPDE